MELGAVLYVYKGEWGLPSIDFECLRSLCLLRFTRSPIAIETSSCLRTACSAPLPYLQIGSKQFTGYEQIKSVLDLQGFDVDAHLNTKQKHLSFTYTNWVFTYIHAYYYYIIFGEPNNYDLVTRSLYAKRAPFPLNFYYPSSHQKEAYDIVEIFGGFDIFGKVDTHGKDFLINKAQKCVNVLSRKLGRKVWFFGNCFSEFDAIVYSYLALIIKISLPYNPLQNHLMGCQNLVNFVNRITNDIFRNEGFPVKPNKVIGDTDHKKTLVKEKNVISEVNTKIVAGIGAVIAMAVFTAYRGLHNQLTSDGLMDYGGHIYKNEETE